MNLKDTILAAQICISKSSWHTEHGKIIFQRLVPNRGWIECLESEAIYELNCNKKSIYVGAILAGRFCFGEKVYP